MNTNNSNNEYDINNNDLKNDWWYAPPKINALLKNQIKDNKKDDNEYDPLMIDSVIKIVKRNYNSIKNDILETLYNKKNDDLIIKKKILK